MTNFNIEIVSDTVCPWCYVGKQKMDKAIKAYQEQYPEDTFSTTWKPYYLAPDSPKKGIDKAAWYEQKFGSERTAMMRERLSQIGKDVGINFKYGGKTGNTRDSHRLIQLGKSKSPAMQTSVISQFFSSYFENEGDITSHAVLTTAAIKAGLPEVEVKEWLTSDRGGPEVDREVEQAKRLGISGVPNFTVQGKYEIGGAQDPEVFLRLFERIKAGEKNQEKISAGEGC